METRTQARRKNAHKNYLYEVTKSTILILGFVVLMILVLTTLFNREYITACTEGSIVHKNSLGFVIGTIVGIGILIVGRNLLANISPKRLFQILSVAFLIAGLFLTFNMSTKLNSSDQLFSLTIANQMNHGNYISLEPHQYIDAKIPFQKSLGGYLAIYPFQLGYITYLRILECFSTNVRFFYLINVFLVILVNYLLYRIVKLITQNNSVQNWTLLLSFAFLPELFFVLFIYGNLPGLCACLAAVYFGLKLIRDGFKKNLSWIWCVLFFVLAYQLKSNYQIAVVALGIVFILHAIKNHKYWFIVMPFVTFALMLGSNKVITAVYEAESGVQINAGLPMITYVAMGLEPHNSQHRGPGWYDAYTINLFSKHHFNAEETSKAAKKKIKSEIKLYTNDPQKAGKFFTDKFISTWADPTFETIWAAPYAEKPQTQILKNIYQNNQLPWTIKHVASWYSGSMKYIAAWCNFIVVVILTLSAGRILRRKLKLDSYSLFATLYLMGGMLFHLIWETKSQYVIQYIICLIPVAAMLLGELTSKKYKK